MQSKILEDPLIAVHLHDLLLVRLQVRRQLHELVDDLQESIDVSTIGKFCRMFAKFANFWRARSRLYQNEILQENMRLAAFVKLYNIICILLHRCNFKILANFVEDDKN